MKPTKTTYIALTILTLVTLATRTLADSVGTTAEGGNMTSHEQIGRVMTHPFVAGEALSKEYSITVNGKIVPVCIARVDELYRQSPLQMDDTYSFASFECSGPVKVVVRSAKPLTSLSIRPNGRDIRVKLEGCEATFTLEHNGNLLIERNGNGRKDPLLLFANPLEVNPPKLDAPGVIYFGPGRHHPGLITLSNNQTLYIDGGAVVTGRVVAQGDNIKILGRGILENSGQEYFGKTMIQLENCNHARVEGIILRKNSQGWTVVPNRCDDVVVSNVKICGSFYGNDDGIDPVNTRNLLIEDCLIRTRDDCLAFKGMNDALSNCENITITSCTLWSDQCCTILLGDESRAAFMRNITIKDCCVPYLSYEGFPKKFLMLHAGDNMHLENVVIENVEIYAEGQNHNYIEMTCETNQYNQTKTAGHIQNIRLKNVNLTGKEGGYFILLKGSDQAHGIDGVTFEDCTINGKPLTSAYPNLQIGEFTTNIRFTSR